MQTTESIISTPERALWYLRSGLEECFAPATVMHAYFLGMQRRRTGAVGSLPDLLPVVAKGMAPYVMFRIVYRPSHPYGYIARIECLDHEQARVYEEKRRLKANDTALIAMVLPDREGLPLLIGRRDIVPRERDTWCADPTW